MRGFPQGFPPPGDSHAFFLLLLRTDGPCVKEARVAARRALQRWVLPRLGGTSVIPARSIGESRSKKSTPARASGQPFRRAALARRPSPRRVNRLLAAPRAFIARRAVACSRGRDLGST